MLGGGDGFLKLLFDTETLKLLGVHAFGEGATEIIHIGQVTGPVSSLWLKFVLGYIAMSAKGRASGGCATVLLQ